MRVVGEVGLENVEVAVQVEVGGRRPHARLLLAVHVVGGARDDADLLEGPVALVVEEKARGRVAGNVHVGPAVVVEVPGQGREPVVVLRGLDAGPRRNVRERAAAVVLVQRHRLPRQAARPAQHRHPLPAAARPLARLRRPRRVELQVVRDEQVQVAVAVEIQEGAARAPARPGLGQPALGGLVAEGSVPLVAVQAVLAPVRDGDIVVPVVVHVAHAGALRPAGVPDAGPLGDVLEPQAPAVAVEVVPGLGSLVREAVRSDQQHVRQAVAVVVDDRDARPGRFDDVALLRRGPGHGHAAQSGLPGDIAVLDAGRSDTGGQRPLRLRRGSGRCRALARQRLRQEQRAGHEGQEPPGNLARRCRHRSSRVSARAPRRTRLPPHSAGRW